MGIAHGGIVQSNRDISTDVTTAGYVASFGNFTATPHLTTVTHVIVTTTGGLWTAGHQLTGKQALCLGKQAGKQDNKPQAFTQSMMSEVNKHAVISGFI